MTKDYLQGMKDGFGSLHKVENKKNEKQPDYTGGLQIDGKVYEIASWIHANKAGTRKYLSLVIKEYKEFKLDTEL
jgi:hypothetical protein